MMSNGRWIYPLCITAGLVVFLVVTATTGNGLVGLRDAGRIVQYIGATILVSSLVAALISWLRGEKESDVSAEHRDEETESK